MKMMKERNMQRIRALFRGVQITEEERRTLEWLAGWESSTVDNLCNVIEKKIRAGRPAEPDEISELF
jgi:hypothetical protein